MDDVDATDRASFGLSLLVALGWYATVAGAVVVGRSGIPPAPERDCSAFFSCLTPLEELALFAIVGAPLVAGLLLCTAAVTALLTRRVASSILAGSLSSVIVTAMFVAAWRGVR